MDQEVIYWALLESGLIMQSLHHALKLGKYARYDSNLPAALSELAIITTGICWSAGFEQEQHAPLVKKAGIDIKYINQIAIANRPIFENQDQQAVYDFAAEANIKKCF